ncbi:MULTISPECIES: DEAD/DEAH box helicase [Marivita]|uniref:DEAD/DEAH box helicase n=1 Tax=Marivita cryptomonadis TaxID=505252 RepID=A0A9Q2NZA1_9RHOB|nr:MULTISPECIES: DEAD/DEAH box helicase [Marivita]MCR9168268.1 DEAD/DEAH box helicase [Paracoccaceae bacterium]MBM2321517.1 DEAD/DEAH box helicase [Marivita cryptomonadis]MBM2331098.1 DEAD/DEAH box helicase [Marivita cryptomonadis]MBM2340684.1 DEAD/DEAH box helicase [Marivita cryptomonadis]MBM2345346.1 DEAD/DEAH box helicase [Marivita cryptomonadis]
MKKALQDALDARGYETLTPVQEAVLNPGYVGADLLVSAQTGSGKTLGFGLAIAPTILEDEAFGPAGAPLALVIAPTRELAMQVKRELAWLYAQAGVVMASTVGGMDMRDERRALERGAHIVVATPGRLRDHIMRSSIDLSQCRAVVLDEADEMLDLGFREDLEFILGEAPEDRQTLLFSATVPPMIAKLAKSYQRDAIRVVTKSETSQHADIAYRAMMVSDRDTDNAVINTLRYYEAPNAIVFANTRAMVNRLTTRLSNRGFQVVALSGELSQTERTHALQAMRDGRAQVCVATDVAARGIDLPNLDLVVHAELPSNHETLLHRSGRTGRAGRKGVSALIVTPKVRKKAERILSMAKLKSDWGSAPSADEVLERDEDRMFADPAWETPVGETEETVVTRLVAEKTPEQIAAAYLRMFREQHTAPEELSDPGAKPEKREEFGPSVWFAVSGGRAADAEPRRILPMVCGAGDLSKDDIGAIRIQQDHSLVQIKESSVARLLNAVGPSMELEKGVTLTKLDKAPDFDRGARPAANRGPKPERKPYGDKPERKSYDDRPKREPREERAKPAVEAAQEVAAKPAPKSAAPIDWNDAPTPRARKPKPADRKPAGKPYGKSDGPARERKPYQGKSDGPARERKPYDDKPSGDRPPRRSESEFQAQPYKGKGKPKGPPPPEGRPDSKKNIARAAARANAGDPSQSMRKPRAGAAKPGGKPTGKFGGKPGGKPAGKFGGKPGGKPGGKK